jgi:hypothetical protein
VPILCLGLLIFPQARSEFGEGSGEWRELGRERKTARLCPALHISISQLTENKGVKNIYQNVFDFSSRRDPQARSALLPID